MRDSSTEDSASRNTPVTAYALCIAALVVAMYVIHGQPAPYANEHVYLLGVRQIVDSDFLAADWTFGQAVTSLANPFQYLMAPIWWLTEDWATTALIGRIVTWAVTFTSLAFVTHALRMRPFVFFLLAFLWGGNRDGLVAHEWIVWTAEQKCFAYSMVFLSLGFLIRRQYRMSGACLGIAIFFHVLVGFWSALAVGFAALLCSENKTRDVGWLTFMAVLTALPALPSAIAYTGSAAPAIDSTTINEILVLFRNPHHLDPNYFLHSTESKLLLLAAIALPLLGQRCIADPRLRRIALGFTVVLVAEFGMGLLASRLQWLGVLKFYPFRVADSLLLLQCWLFVPIFVSGSLLRPFTPKERSFGTLAARFSQFALLVAALWLLLPLAAGSVGDFRAQAPSFFSRWDMPNEDPKFEAAAAWIRTQTPKDSQFIVDPCLQKFWISAERAPIVQFKATPVNASVLEWHNRLTYLNGGKAIRKRGVMACKEIQQRYRRLAKPTLEEGRERYGADYFFLSGRRDDLRDALVFSNGTYWIYDLEQIEQ